MGCWFRCQGLVQGWLIQNRGGGEGLFIGSWFRCQGFVPRAFVAMIPCKEAGTSEVNCITSSDDLQLR